MLWALTRENLNLLYANNKRADQPAHPRSLITAFVILCQDSIIANQAACKVSVVKLFSVAEQTGLSPT